MSESVVKEVLIKAIKELEETGDIVVVNPTLSRQPPFQASKSGGLAVEPGARDLEKLA